MKIVYIVPGFGGTFYCGNCLRDSAFSKSLKNIGHESVNLPLYLPNTMDDYVQHSEVPVFFGAVNIYLKQNFKLFRKMPKWLYNFFNSPIILKYAAKKSESTRAEGLEEMTISMLKGANGYQKEELDMLISYLKNHEKPDVVHLSNALLMGLAAKIKEELKVPVFCSLQDEDVWIDAMSEQYKPILWKLMSEKAADIDAFISVSNFFAAKMQLKMQIPKHKIQVVHIGVDKELYEVSPPAQNPPVIGYLSRMNEENGLGILIDAFLKLKSLSEFRHLKLKLNGGKTHDDDQFINTQKRKLAKSNFLHDVEFVNDFRTATISDFFKSLTVLCVPVIHGEAFGLYQIEALATGTPIVQPDVGAFSEIVEASGGGVIYSPNTANALTAKLSEVLLNIELLNRMSRNGRKSIETEFNTKTCAEKLIRIYENVLEKNKSNDTSATIRNMEFVRNYAVD